MPPVPTWFQGHDTLRPWLLRDPLPLRWRHHPTRVNGQLAVGCYLHDDERSCYTPAVIDVLTLSGDKIAAVTAFLVMNDPGRGGFFARFGLPAELPA
jgi:RNA polymerase sigma-70 factor, ECF subfamily